MAEQIRVNIPADQLKDQICTCKNGLWIAALQLKIVPPLYSASGKREYLALHTGFLCTNCGTLIPIRPAEEESSIIVFPGREN